MHKKPQALQPAVIKSILYFFSIRKDPNHPCKAIRTPPSERETGIEPATPTLARWCSTAEPLALTLRF